MSRQTLLIEIGCEELPPKSLETLARSLRENLHKGLVDALLIPAEASSQWFATPRRLAVRIPQVAVRQPDRTEQRLGPAVAAAFDADGNATRAATGFAASCGATVEDLERIETPKGERLGVTRNIPGSDAPPLIVAALERALSQLPIPKPMRWGANDFSFVRPVHWVIGLLGDSVIPGELYGCTIGRTSRGHRFLSGGEINVDHPDSYESILRDAHVIVDPEERRDIIRSRTGELAQEAGGRAVMRDALVGEVSSLVEWPVPILGAFDEDFLKVPSEALISSMEGHQKCFPVVTDSGELMPCFITVANSESKSPEEVRRGFERVIRPRLADARFFWDTDRKESLESHGKALAKMVYQRQLGTLADKSSRVARLAGGIADELRLDRGAAERAATLAKCDLLTQMVGEFPELQGTMGRYYAAASGESEAVSVAIEEAYRPRFADDALPATPVGSVLALAERLDTLVGIFAVGMKPSGNKDPFALRRAALGLARLCIEGDLDIDLQPWLEHALSLMPEGLPNADSAQTDVLAFVFDRLQGYYVDQGVSKDVFAAVRAIAPTRLADFDQRIKACARFAGLPESQALAAANKRIGNIIAKSEAGNTTTFDSSLTVDRAEKALASAVAAAAADTAPLREQRQYQEILSRLASLRECVDTFFDEVLVNAEDPALRANRLALLAKLKAQFDAVADIAELARAS